MVGFAGRTTSSCIPGILTVGNLSNCICLVVYVLVTALDQSDTRRPLKSVLCNNSDDKMTKEAIIRNPSHRLLRA